MGKQDEAEAIFAEVLARKSNHVLALTRSAAILIAKNQHTEALLFLFELSQPKR